MRNPPLYGHWQVSCASASCLVSRLRHLLVGFCNFFLCECIKAKLVWQFSPVSRSEININADRWWCKIPFCSLLKCIQIIYLQQEHETATLYFGQKRSICKTGYRPVFLSKVPHFPSQYSKRLQHTLYNFFLLCSWWNYKKCACFNSVLELKLQ